MVLYYIYTKKIERNTSKNEYPPCSHQERVTNVTRHLHPFSDDTQGCEITPNDASTVPFALTVDVVSERTSYALS